MTRLRQTFVFLVLCWQTSQLWAFSLKELEKCGPHDFNKRCEGTRSCSVECPNGLANNNGSVNFKTKCVNKKWEETCQKVPCGTQFEIELGYNLSRDIHDPWGCKAPKEDGKENECYCNKKIKLKDEERDVMVVGKPTVKCVKDEKSNLVSEFVGKGHCAMACKKQIENQNFVEQFDKDSIDKCLLNNKSQRQQCDLECRKDVKFQQKAIAYDTGNGKKGTYCDNDGEWVTNTRCSKTCPTTGEFTNCKDKFEQDKCKIDCRGMDQTAQGEKEFETTCVYNENRGDVEWNTNYFTECNVQVPPTTVAPPTTTEKPTTEEPSTETEQETSPSTENDNSSTKPEPSPNSDDTAEPTKSTEPNNESTTTDEPETTTHDGGMAIKPTLLFLPLLFVAYFFV